jgi:hypothetical protein
LQIKNVSNIWKEGAFHPITARIPHFNGFAVSGGGIAELLT